MNKMLDGIGNRLVEFLSKPISKYEPMTTNGPELLRQTIRPGDVLLVEGNSRVSSAIKYLTQSTWSHAALCVGPLENKAETDGEPHILVEAELGLGVISSPLSRHASFHSRICRPIALASEDLEKIKGYAISRIGHDYDVKNVLDLMRYLMPTPPVPTRLRRRMIALGSGEPTRAICSTLIAEAFNSVRYPILPKLELLMQGGLDAGEAAMLKEIHHIRHHSLFTPRDFDISPYFKIVKPTVRRGFDYRTMAWSDSHAEGG